MSAARTGAARAALAKLAADGARPEEIVALRRRLEQLAEPDAGLLPGEQLDPVSSLPSPEELPAGRPRSVLDRLVVVKLNGGLGTTMGLARPKALIEVEPGCSFLDVVARQVLHLRSLHGVRLPLVLMNSFATRAASLDALRSRHPALTADVPADFLQGRQPKLRADTYEPVRWPANPGLEWCPPGHGDLYVALAASGMLATLRAAGYRWAFVSNVDNLGASVEPRIAAWAETARVPFVMEVVPGTPSDRKGGHLALRDGRLVLRETAQVPAGDASFNEVDRWRFYNTNNLWIDIEALDRLLAEQPAGPDLPLIVNRKHVDPTDPSSPAVLHLETAMGAALGAIDGARAICVPRSRFAPVKTTDDLLVVRSDAYELSDAGTLVPRFDGEPPLVTLDPAVYGSLDRLDFRFPGGPPSLRHCRRMTVRGEVTFGPGVVVEGTVELRGPARVGEGERLAG